MSTGISISSINRIKELAEEKKYAEALEILDTQNLDKSINPQFLRISGEIFRENKRYYDSRKILMKAHQMSPQGTRIIFELIQLYLELGYFTRAKRYYEQYQFYVSEDDAQKDHVEYVMKKALGADVKELASILIPILEQMPEDRWNFEAVLLYDKMDRKDKALEESQYILEHFKESIYIAPIIAYIDDKLDVDQYFYIYPSEEQEEDTELFGDLIEQEEKLLEADYLSMYPPEARIMVEAEDKDAIVDTKPDKKKKSRKKNKKEDIETSAEGATGEDNVQDIIREAEQLISPEAAEAVENNSEEKIQIKQEREAALERLLSQKIDTDKIKESAKQVAKAVKEIDTEKAKNQVKSVAETVKGNVKKATDALGEAVGTKPILEGTDVMPVQSKENPEEQIVDGIIESVLEPPKRAVGQVVMNEELDALVPDSLEAMSMQEIADIEAKKEEIERLELEALEASLQLEEQKKAKSRLKKEAKTASDSSDTENPEADVQDILEQRDSLVTYAVEGNYAELKEKFLTEWVEEEDQPLDSLGFISVVHSDVDQTMEEAIPDAAGMLRQMIDNKEFYSGEDSTKFESKASYLNHGFEVEGYEFEAYKDVDVQSATQESGYNIVAEPEQGASFTVEDIYAQEQILYFDDIIPEELTKEESEPIIEKAEPIVEEAEPVIAEVEAPVVEEAEPIIAEEPVVEFEPYTQKTGPMVAVEVEPVIGAEWNVEESVPVMVAEPMIVEETEPIIVEEAEPVIEEVEAPVVEEAEPVIVETEPMIVEEAEPVIEEAEPLVVEEAEPVMVETEPMIVEEAEPVIAEVEASVVEEAEPVMVETEPMIVEEAEPVVAEAEPIGEQAEVPARRDVLRVKILLSDSMMNMLVNLKESR